MKSLLTNCCLFKLKEYQVTLHEKMAIYKLFQSKICILNLVKFTDKKQIKKIFWMVFVYNGKRNEMIYQGAETDLPGARKLSQGSQLYY